MGPNCQQLRVRGPRVRERKERGREACVRTAGLGRVCALGRVGAGPKLREEEGDPVGPLGEKEGKVGVGPSGQNQGEVRVFLFFFLFFFKFFSFKPFSKPFKICLKYI